MISILKVKFSLEMIYVATFVHMIYVILFQAWLEGWVALGLKTMKASTSHSQILGSQRVSL